MTIEQPEVVKILDALITFQRAGDIDAQARLTNGLNDVDLALCLGEAISQYVATVAEFEAELLSIKAALKAENVTATISAPAVHQPQVLPSPRLNSTVSLGLIRGSSREARGGALLSVVKP